MQHIMHVQMATKTTQLTKKPEKQGIYLYSKRRTAPYRHSGHLVVEALSWEKIKNMVHEADLEARVAASKKRAPTPASAA